MSGHGEQEFWKILPIGSLKPDQLPETVQEMFLFFHQRLTHLETWEELTVRELKAAEKAYWRLESRLTQLEQQFQLQQQEASKDLSAPTTGRVEKPSQWPLAPRRYVLTGSQEEILQLITQVITDYSKLTESMPVALVATQLDSSTLKLTLWWPTPSGSITEDGDPGPVPQTEDQVPADATSSSPESSEPTAPGDWLELCSCAERLDCIHLTNCRMVLYPRQQEGREPR